MADQDIFHTAELVKAAIPFVDNRTQGMADLFVKVCDLMGSVKTAKSSQNLAACGFTLESIDIEGLLAAVRPVCNKRERDIVDRILNLFHMKKMFEMYNSMMETMKNMQDVGGFPFGDMNAENASNIFSNFSGSNFESIFQTVKAFTAQSTDNNDNNTDSHESSSDSENVNEVYAAEVNHYTNGENIYHPETNEGYGSATDYGYTSTSGYANGSASNQGMDYDRKEYSAASDMAKPQTDQTVEEILRDIKSAAAADSFSNYNMGLGSGFGSTSTLGSGSSSSSASGSGSSSALGSSSAPGSSSAQGSSSAPGSSSATNSAPSAGSNTTSAQSSSQTPMLDMLKTMVPSDKMNTFENLSMLFNSMSYDNNSKSDDQKGE